MCGILCELSSPACGHYEEREFFVNAVNHRNTYRKELFTFCIQRLLKLLRNRGSDVFHVFQPRKNIIFGGFVLWHQGKHLCRQPIENDFNICILNGDIFNILNKNYDTNSDSYWLSCKLSECRTDYDIFNLLKTMEGSYSVVFYDKIKYNLYFARDILGRNSLLIEKDRQILRIISTSFSSADFANIVSMEVPCIGLYKINIFNTNVLTLLPWESLETSQLKKIDDLSKSLKISIITKRTNNLNCVYSFGSKTIQYDFYDICENSQLSNQNIFKNLCTSTEVSEYLHLYLCGLEHSVKSRVETTTQFCNNCIETLNEYCNHSKIALLFSGGIDCTILAVLIDKFVDKKDSIDLINVAFQAKNKNFGNWNVPDRCTGKKSLNELKRLCPQRKWNFVEVNVSRQKLEIYLSDHIRDLIFPLNTVLDESLGCAFWFASRGIGVCNGDKYKSSSRVVIVGSGADELFGGYTRHRTTYNHCSGSHKEKLNQLHDELEIDWKRISSRNLGRDDRVIADNGKTVRAPFIEEFLVNFVRKLKPEQRCCFTLDPGIGDKLFLRLCGYKLGLRTVLTEKKRAIQFGSRIASKQQHCLDKSIFL